MLKELTVKALIGEVIKHAPKFIRKLTKEKRFAFISTEYTTVKNRLGFRNVYLPMKHGELSDETEREDTIEVLKNLKYTELGARRNSKVMIHEIGLPVISGLVIGYSLHSRDNMKIIYEDGELSYENTYPKSAKLEDPVILDKRKNRHDAVDLCVYIQAKDKNAGSSAFSEYVKESLSNPYCVSLISVQHYKANVNLEKTAERLENRIMEQYAILEKEHSNKIMVHLFYNGFFGLALLLGNKLAPSIPIQLYDFNVKKGYRKSFQLSGGNLNEK